MKDFRNAQTIFLFDLIFLFTSFWLVFVHFNKMVYIPAKTLPLMGFAAILWFFVLINSKVTSITNQTRVRDIIVSVFVGYSILSSGLIGTVSILGNFKDNTKIILFPLLFALIASLMFRFVCLFVSRHFVKKGYLQKSVLLVGGGRIAALMVAKIRECPEFGYKLYGILADEFHETLDKSLRHGPLARFTDVVRSGVIDEVIIALPLRYEKVIADMVNSCEHEGIRFRIVPDIFRITHNRVTMEMFDDIPLIAIRNEPLNLMRHRFIKRTFDIIFSLCVLIFLLPVFVVLAIIIKLSDPGPVFFKQKRVGANNKEFFIYKFRTMKIQQEKESNIIWTSEYDDRVTRLGRFMRKKNLDELPQFWNVLVGEMSVVGPRPERGFFVEQFRKDIPNYKVRHLVKSGITGWAQVNGYRGDTSITERVKHDIYYLESWSFWFDLRNIWLTLFGRNTNKNAY